MTACALLLNSPIDPLEIAGRPFSITPDLFDEDQRLTPLEKDVFRYICRHLKKETGLAEINIRSMAHNMGKRLDRTLAAALHVVEMGWMPIKQRLGEYKFIFRPLNGVHERWKQRQEEKEIQLAKAREQVLNDLLERGIYIAQPQPHTCGQNVSPADILSPAKKDIKNQTTTPPSQTHQDIENFDAELECCSFLGLSETLPPEWDAWNEEKSTESHDDEQESGEEEPNGDADKETTARYVSPQHHGKDEHDSKTSEPSTPTTACLQAHVPSPEKESVSLDEVNKPDAKENTSSRREEIHPAPKESPSPTHAFPASQGLQSASQKKSNESSSAPRKTPGKPVSQGTTPPSLPEGNIACLTPHDRDIIERRLLTIPDPQSRKTVAEEIAQRLQRGKDSEHRDIASPVGYAFQIIKAVLNGTFTASLVEREQAEQRRREAVDREMQARREEEQRVKESRESNRECYQQHLNGLDETEKKAFETRFRAWVRETSGNFVCELYAKRDWVGPHIDEMRGEYVGQLMKGT
jgi:hypothetical protein